MADLAAQLDQLQAACTNVAHTLGHYRDELIHDGFSSDDALELCIDLQRAVIFGDNRTPPV